MSIGSVNSCSNVADGSGADGKQDADCISSEWQEGPCTTDVAGPCRLCAISDKLSCRMAFPSAAAARFGFELSSSARSSILGPSDMDSRRTDPLRLPAIETQNGLLCTSSRLKWPGAQANGLLCSRRFHMHIFMKNVYFRILSGDAPVTRPCAKVERTAGLQSCEICMAHALTPRVTFLEWRCTPSNRSRHLGQQLTARRRPGGVHKCIQTDGGVRHAPFEGAWGH